MSRDHLLTADIRSSFLEELKTSVWLTSNKESILLGPRWSTWFTLQISAQNLLPCAHYPLADYPLGDGYLRISPLDGIEHPSTTCHVNTFFVFLCGKIILLLDRIDLFRKSWLFHLKFNNLFSRETIFRQSNKRICVHLWVDWEWDGGFRYKKLESTPYIVFHIGIHILKLERYRED